MSRCSICKWRHAWDCEDYRSFGNPANCKDFELGENCLTEEEKRQYAIMRAAFMRGEEK